MRTPRSSRPALAAALVAFVLLVVATVVPAAAASLKVVGGTRAYGATAARCTNGPLTVSPTGTANASGQYTSVKVTGITGTVCTGGRVILYRSAAPSTVLLSANGTLSAGTLTATSSAFTPPASGGALAYVTLNGWAVPATWSFTPPAGNRCEVRNANGSVDTTKPCSITGAPSFAFWGSAGAGQGNGGADFSAPGIANDQYVAFTLTITGAPAGWSWSTSGLTSINNSASVSSSCSSLPTFSGQLGPNKGATPNAFVSFVENRAGQSGIVCLVP